MSATVAPSVTALSAARFAPASAPGALDIALAYSAPTLGCDLVWQGGDWACDTTPATAMLMALGCDRRANPTDTLPDAPVPSAPGVPTPLVDQRRGWCGDALDAQGRRAGSRLWLLARAPENRQTQVLAQSAAAEALAPVQAMYGVAIQVAARWVAPGVLGLRASAGPVSVTVTQRVAT